MIPSECKLLSMLSNNDVTFFIPPYQRNYEWTDDQCKVFLEDIQKTKTLNLTGTNAEHFFGTITYFQTEAVFGQPNKLVLIDGQQRITTTMLFLVALRDIVDDENTKQFIDSKYLKNNNVHGDVEYKIKLKQVETDWVAYKKIILSEELTEREKNSAVYRNYKYFLNKLLVCKSNGEDVGSIIEKGLNRFSIITIQLEPDKNAWENPQEIFESMNSLGKPLSLADLVRNYLLLGLDPNTQSDLYNRYWLHIEQVIPNRVSDFIRDYMQASEKRPFAKSTENNYKDLYSSFKSVFGNCDTKELLKDLSENATYYSYIVTGCTGNRDVDLKLKDINTMGLTTIYSFLLVLFREWKNEHFSDNEIIDVLESFRVYSLRRRIIGLTSGENKGFPALVNQIAALVNSENKKTTMFNILANQENTLRLPNDIELTRMLENMNFYNFRYAKLYLSMVEEKLTKSRPNLDDEKLQIEHIMPKTLSEEWKTALGDNYEEVYATLINNIGNLTLIRHNQELGNKPFAQKKQIYENNAGLQVAKNHIINQDVWNEETIKERNKWITDYLLTEVLPIPNNMRRVNNFKMSEGKHLSFQELQIIGETISFIYEPSITALVVSDKEVEFEGKRWRLSPLTREIQERRGMLNTSGTYSGAYWWAYDGMKLSEFI